MKLVCISDTHGKHAEVEVPEGDILVHAGDCTIYGTSDDLKDFLKWFAALPHCHKILIAGNHDWIFERNPTKASQIIQRHAPGIVYLEHACCVLQGFKIFGSPITPEFCNWAFNRTREQLREAWEFIPQDSDIIVTHGPVFHGRDFAPFDKQHVGDADLRYRLEQVRPKAHVCGHIHFGYGTAPIPHEHGTYLEVNASVVNEAYEVVNKPIVLDFCNNCKHLLSGDEWLDREVHGRCGL